MLVWEGTVRNSESRSRSLQLVRLSALHNFKVCGALRTLVGMNGIVPFVPPLSKNHCARGRTYQAVVGHQSVNSVIRGNPMFLEIHVGKFVAGLECWFGRAQ